jgi:hypothetical protein
VENQVANPGNAPSPGPGPNVWVFAGPPNVAYPGYAQPRGKGAGITTVASIAVGIVLFGLMAHYWRPAEKPPRIVPVPGPVVEKPVYREVVKYFPAPTPEKKPEPPPVATAPAPLQKIEVVETAGEWEGTWMPANGRTFPLFKIRQQGQTLAGEYAPRNFTGTYAFVHGRVKNGVGAFSVTDELKQTIHFRFTPSGDGMDVVTWITVGDIMEYLNLALKGKSPAQRQALAPIIRREVAKAGNEVSIGVFKLANDPGKEP